MRWALGFIFHVLAVVSLLLFVVAAGLLVRGYFALDRVSLGDHSRKIDAESDRGHFLFTERIALRGNGMESFRITEWPTTAWTYFHGVSGSRLRQWPVDAVHRFAGVEWSSGIFAQADRQVFVEWRQVSIPDWMALAGAGLLPLCWRILFRGRRMRRKWVKRGCCGRCSYDIRATPTQCPECGATGAEITDGGGAWTRRRKIGFGVGCGATVAGIVIAGAGFQHFQSSRTGVARFELREAEIEDSLYDLRGVGGVVHESPLRDGISMQLRSYVGESFSAALRRLRKDRRVERPWLVAAAIYRAEGVVYLAYSTVEVAGATESIILLDGDRVLGKYPRDKNLHWEIQEDIQASAWDGLSEISFAPAPGGSADAEKSPVIHLPRTALSGSVRMKLVGSTTGESAAIPVFVDLGR